MKLVVGWLEGIADEGQAIRCSVSSTTGEKNPGFAFEIRDPRTSPYFTTELACGNRARRHFFQHTHILGNIISRVSCDLALFRVGVVMGTSCTMLQTNHKIVRTPCHTTT